MRCHHSSSPPPLGTDQPGAGQFMLISLALLLTGHDHQTGPAVVPAVFHVSVASVTAFFFFFGQFVILFAFCLFFVLFCLFPFLFLLLFLSFSLLSICSFRHWAHLARLHVLHANWSECTHSSVELHYLYCHYHYISIWPFLHFYTISIWRCRVRRFSRQPEWFLLLSPCGSLLPRSPTLSLSRFPLTGHTWRQEPIWLQVGSENGCLRPIEVKSKAMLVALYYYHYSFYC